MRALVTGVSGQDGYYMTALLARKGIEVVGTSRDSEGARKHFPIEEFPGVILESLDYTKSGAISSLFNRYAPTLVFNFAAQATGAGMFDAPTTMGRINGTFVVDILESIRTSKDRDNIVFCQASSSEMFGDVTASPQDEGTPLRPKSPYGAAKTYAHHMTGIYRSAFGLRACSAILFNHESVRRSTQFVTRKIANGVARIKFGVDDKLQLGSLSTYRDWGYAPEYVEAMYLMATAAKQSDYVVASGRLNSLRRLCEIAFGHVGLNYEDYIEENSAGHRINHSINLHGDPSNIHHDLGWSAQRTIEEIMIELVEHELNTFAYMEPPKKGPNTTWK